MWMRALFGVASVVTVVGMLWGSVSPAQACLCLSSASVEEQVQTADVIVVGKVISFERANIATDGQPGGGYFPRLTLRADHYLKGSGSSHVTASWEWCGPAGSVGDRYVAFLHGYEGKLSDSPCFGSSPIVALWPGVNLAEVEGITGPGEPPGDSPSPPSHRGDFPRLPAAIAATLGPLAFLAGAAFLWRPGGESVNG